jgi:peptidoglycan/LPS O-acetylase OafA/YrhL
MGLRGFAILLIVLFHLRADHFTYGFLGVDIFLVISGFLLFRGYQSNFKIIPFIHKKVLRIVPLMKNKFVALTPRLVEPIL